MPRAVQVLSKGSEFHAHSQTPKGAVGKEVGAEEAVGGSQWGFGDFD